MKLTVLGATGGVGRRLVEHALADGHEVVAAVRDTSRLPVRDDALTVTQVDPLDERSVRGAVDGSDAVLSAMGAVGRRDPLKPVSTSARAVAGAMKATGTRRIVVVSAGTLNRGGDGMPFFARRVLTPILWGILRDVYTDMEDMEATLRDSGLDWTSVRPPRLTDKPGTGRYRRTLDGGPVGLSVPRADLARAMLDLLEDHETFGRAVGVSA